MQLTCYTIVKIGVPCINHGVVPCGTPCQDREHACRACSAQKHVRVPQSCGELLHQPCASASRRERTFCAVLRIYEDRWRNARLRKYPCPLCCWTCESWCSTILRRERFDCSALQIQLICSVRTIGRTIIFERTFPAIFDFIWLNIYFSPKCCSPD